jgi:hypothetical protein
MPRQSASITTSQAASIWCSHGHRGAARAFTRAGLAPIIADDSRILASTDSLASEV